MKTNDKNSKKRAAPPRYDDVCPSGRLGLVGFVFQGCNKPVHSFEAHCVDGFSVCACGHVSLAGIDILICLQEKVPVEQVAVQPVIDIAGLR